jgi:Pterin binding enzyme
MAVINRTPDSFFDRGATRDFGPALDAASRAVADGAEIVDIGGVKAGPGDEVTPAAEIDRVAGLVAAVRERHPDVVISGPAERRLGRHRPSAGRGRGQVRYRPGLLARGRPAAPHPPAPARLW